MDLTAQEACELIYRHGIRGPVIMTDIREAQSRGLVLASDIRSDRDLPPFNRAMVDGYAIRSSDLNGGIREFTVIGQLRAGSSDSYEIGEGETLEIMTGAPVPSSADALIKYEGSNRLADGRVTFHRTNVEPFFNIARQGEDLKSDSVVALAGSRIDNTALPSLSAVGAYRVDVIARPTVSLVSTGDEVVEIDQSVLPHQIREGSSLAIATLLSHYGIELKKWIKVSDTPGELQAALKKGADESDLLLVTGAVSMGVTDVVPGFLQDLGYDQVFHKLKVKPGKPLWFGVKSDGKAAFGLPGNPVSSQVSFKVFVERWIRKWMGLHSPIPLRLPIAQRKSKDHDLEEYRQCRIVNRELISMLEPIAHHGSGDFIHLTGSHGLLIHPKDTMILEEGDYVDFLLWREF